MPGGVTLQKRGRVYVFAGYQSDISFDCQAGSMIMMVSRIYLVMYARAHRCIVSELRNAKLDGRGGDDEKGEGDAVRVTTSFTRDEQDI